MSAAKIAWLFCGFSFPLPAAELGGRVIDGITREPLTRVVVHCSDSASTETNAAGNFSLTCLPEDVVTISTVGYRTARLPAPSGDIATEVEVKLFPSTFRREESIRVVAGPFAREAPSSVSLEGLELKNSPSILTDDPLRAAHVLPGATSSDDFTSQFSVRGAGFPQVALYFDGVLLHQPFHAVQGEQTSGSATMVSAEILEGINLHSSAPPPRFGDRTAGALDLRPRDGDRNRVTARSTISLSNAAGVVEGPLPNRRGSWLVSARASYFQYLVEKISNDPSLAFGFTDGQARLRYDLTPRHTATLNLLAGESGLDRTRRAGTAGPNTLITGDYAFRLASAAVRSTAGSSFVLTNTVAWMQEQSVNRNREASPLYGSKYAEWAGMSDGQWGLRSSTLLEFGTTFRRVRDDGFVYRYTFVPATVRPLERFRGAGLRSGGYAQLSRSWLEGRVTLSGGGRIDAHSLAPPLTVSPYVSAAFQVLPPTRLSLAYSQAVQYPEIAQLLSLFTPGALLPSRAQHLQLSLDHRINERTRLRIEGWQRLDRDLLGRPLGEVRLDTGRLIPPLIESPWQNSARAYGRGAQILLQRRSANALSGWVAYSWGKTTVRDGVLRRAYPSDFDQRHQMQMFANWRMRPTVNLSGRFLFGSGMPLPGFYHGSTATDIFVAAERNGSRLPAYHRLDLRVTKSWQAARLRWTIFGDVINVLNHKNYRVDANAGYDMRTGRARISFLTMIPLLPSAGLALEF